MKIREKSIRKIGKKRIRIKDCKSKEKKGEKKEIVVKDMI